LQVGMLNLTQFWFAACVAEENERKDQISTTDSLSYRSKRTTHLWSHFT
jgi:hypothetical protein